MPGRKRIHAIEAAVIRAVQMELENARKQFPTNENLLFELSKRVSKLPKLFDDHTIGKRNVYAIGVYMALVEVIVLGVRLIEEGDSAYAYRQRPSGEDELPLQIVR